MLQFASQDLQGDTELVLQAAVRNITALALAPKKLLGNREFMLRVARSCFFCQALHGGRHRFRSSDGFRAEWDRGRFEHIFMEHLDGFRGGVDFELLFLVLQYASEDLLCDEDFIQGAADIAKHFVRRRSQHDEMGLVLKAVQLDGLLLAFAPKWQDTRQLVLEAVQQNGLALQFASEDLKADRLIVRQACQQNHDSLEFASAELRRTLKRQPCEIL